MRQADFSGSAPAPTGPRRAIFVYYKVAREHVRQLQAAFHNAVEIPSPSFGSLRHAELMRRAENPGSPAAGPHALQTWMEIYWLEESPQAPRDSSPEMGAWEDIESLRLIIEDRARAAGIVDLVDGPRHYEAFESCA